MEKSVLTSKTTSTTPFSINDILTKNNTSIIPRSPDLSRVNTSSENDCQFDKSDNVSETKSESGIHEQINYCKKTGFRGSLQYYNNNNNRSPYQPLDRRRSLDCFLVKSESQNEDYDGLRNGDVKSGYFNFMARETPLDMRRCNNDDSGENIWFKIVRFHVIYSFSI